MSLKLAKLIASHTPRINSTITPLELAFMLAAQDAQDKPLWILADVIAELSLPRATASETLGKLIERGYLARTRYDFDHKKYHLTLTPAGQRALRSARIWSES